MFCLVADAHGHEIVNEHDLHRDNHGVWCRWCGNGVRTRYMGDNKARAVCQLDRCRNHARAVRCIVNVMCNRMFMCGSRGDVSPEFRQLKYGELMDMEIGERAEWMHDNLFTLCTHCRVPKQVILMAIMVFDGRD